MASLSRASPVDALDPRRGQAGGSGRAPAWIADTGRAVFDDNAQNLTSYYKQKPTPQEAALEASEYFSPQSAQQPTEAGRFFNIDGVPSVHMSEGLDFRPLLGQRMLVSFVSFGPHVEAPKHTHSEEQVVIVLDGEIEFDLDGDVRILHKWDVVVIPPWVPHGARTRESSCRELDVFCPPRRALLELLASPDAASTESGS